MSRALIVKGADFSENAVARINQELPYDAEVTFIQSDGSAYINTGVKVSSNLRFSVKFTIPTSAKADVFAARVGTYDSNYILYRDANLEKWNFRYGSNFGESSKTTISFPGDFTANNIDSPNIVVIGGDDESTVSIAAESFTTNLDLYLFAWNNNGEIPQNTSDNVKLKSLKLYEGSTLVRDYISVRVGQVGYLYDKVSKELFGNAAESGALVIGADK